MQRKISIIGAAGTLGSCAAFAIATRGLADELVLIDLKENYLKCHAMDIEQAVTGLADMEVRAGSFEDMDGSDVVVNAAGAPWRYIESRMELLNDSMPIIRNVAKQIERFCPDAVVVTATNPVDPLNYAMHLVSKMDPKKLVGYSVNDSVRFRMLVARALKVKTTSVEGFTIGEHGEHQVMLFSSVRVNGERVHIKESVKKEIREGVPKILNTYEKLGTGRTSGWTSAVGLAAMVSAITGGSERFIPCSVILNGEYGYEGLSASVPVRLGPKGVEKILELELPPEEKENLKGAMGFLKDVCRSVDGMISETD